MNRLRAPAAAPTKPSPLDLRFEPIVEEGIVGALAGEAPATVFAPIHYERNYAYPLVVWLHGEGQDERQLVRLMPQLSLRNYVGVAPRGTQTHHGGRGYRWSDDPSAFAAAEQRVWEAIDSARGRYHIARRRVFLAGADAGGAMALRIALAQPNRFAGVLSFGGTFPSGGTPLARLHDVRKLPLFLAYDREPNESQSESNADQLSRMMQLFFTAGMHVMLRQYPRQSMLGKQMLADADRWMMDLVTSGAI
jgi:phospholipase/carboxylesterase